MLDNKIGVVGGVDTHADTHTAAAVDEVGRFLGHATFAASDAGFAELLRWLRAHGPVVAVGVEGTGSYGAGLSQHLTAAGIVVVEVDRPDRRLRRKHGKSDPVDAEAAARAVLAGTAAGVPKARNGAVESIRALRVARGAPSPLSDRLGRLPTDTLVKTCSSLRPGTTWHDLADPSGATKRALRRIARRCQQLAVEINEADIELKELIEATAPPMLRQLGVGIDVAGQLLITAGDNPQRLHSEASFAALCGSSPVPASSGRTDRHRLNRGGDRAANKALYTVVIVRMRCHQPTRDCVDRRRAQGLTNKEIIRCLKRNVARELLPIIQHSLATP